MLRTVVLAVALSALLVGLASRAVRAKEFLVNDDEQKNILVICQMAAKSPAADLDTMAGIAQFCVAWRNKMQAAEKSVEPKPKE